MIQYFETNFLDLVFRLLFVFDLDYKDDSMEKK